MTGLLTALAFIAGILCARAWRRAGHDMDQAVANMCDPCHGKPGRCTCVAKSDCTHPLCGAPDTVISDRQFAEELAVLLEEGSE